MSKTYILHGWSYSTEKWKPLVALLKARGIEVEQLKIPGLTDGTSQVLTLDDYIDWLGTTLKTEEKVNLIGHSNGGRISLAFTSRYPEKVAHLILVDSAGIYPRGLMITLKRTIFKAVAKIGKKITTSETIRALLYKVAREGDYKKATPEMRQTMANLLSVDLRSVLGNITVPTLIIWGAQDKSTPLSDAKVMHAGIVHSRLFVISAAGHSPHITHPEEVVGEIVKELV